MPVFSLLDRMRQLVGRVESTVPDVGEDDGGVGEVGDKLVGVATIARALATGNTRSLGVLVEGIGRVEPKHARVEVAPDGHGEDHTILELASHLGVTTKSLVMWVV